MNRYEYDVYKYGGIDEVEILLVERVSVLYLKEIMKVFDMVVYRVEEFSVF